DVNEGKTKVTLSGIKVESKKFDKKPVHIDIHSVVCSEPSIIDFSALKYKFEVLDENGNWIPSPKKLHKEYEDVPDMPGHYRMTVTLSEENIDYYGGQVIEFDITE
ncbi:MAG: hypothetical protein K6F84_05690, partial [Lachnospiraceae bacterium]|nr:hypothetical protein [Lachnospiraceae bacterium]